MTNEKHAKIISRKDIYKSFHHFEVVEAEPKSLKHDGYAPMIEREMMCTRAGAIVLIYLPATDEIVLAEQFRMGPFLAEDKNPFLMECAAGYIDAGETPEETVRREAREETGCAITDMEFVGFFYPTPGSSTERFYIYAACAEKARAGVYGLAEEAEEIRTHVLPAPRVIDMLDNHEITNASAAIALHWFARHYDRLRKKWSVAA